MKITNKVEYSDKLTIISTSYPNEKYPDYTKYNVGYPNAPTYLYYINMSFNPTFQAHWHFPTTEIKGIQAINTLLIIDKIFKVIKDFSIDHTHTTVIINCDVGGNRSFNVVECFRYLKTGEVDECFRHSQLPHILDYVKMVEDRRNIEEVMALYITKLYNIGILNAKTI